MSNGNDEIRETLFSTVANPLNEEEDLVVRRGKRSKRETMKKRSNK